jgi:hypothetical protein
MVAMTDVPKKRRWWVIPTIVLAIVSIIAFAPAICVIISSVLASIFHCQVDEGDVHPCHAFGGDIGNLLYFLFVMGWMMLLTIPVMLAAVLGWIVLGIVAVGRAWRGKTA